MYIAAKDGYHIPLVKILLVFHECNLIKNKIIIYLKVIEARGI